MTKKYLKKTFEKYNSKNKFKFEETYLKQFLDILKNSKKAKLSCRRIVVTRFKS